MLMSAVIVATLFGIILSRQRETRSKTEKDAERESESAERDYEASLPRAKFAGRGRPEPVAAA